MARSKFTPQERGLIATAAGIVFTRVFGISLVLTGFRAYGLTLTSNEVLIGTALSAYAVTLAIMQLPLGILSDRIGRKPVLVAGTLLFVAGSVWSAYAGSITTLIAARLLQGLGAVSSTAMAAVGETIPESRRTTAMAMVGIPAGVGFLLGLIAGTTLQSAGIGIPGLFLITAALGLLAGAPVLLLKWPAPTHTTQAVGDRRSLGLPVMALALAGFTVNYALTTSMFFLPDIEAHGLTHAGLVIVLVAAFIIMAVVSRQVDRRGVHWQPIALFLLLLTATAPLMATGTTLALLYVGGIGFFASHAILSAVLPSQVSRLAGRSGGRGHGIQNVVAYAGTSLAGPVAGYFAHTPIRAFWVLAGVAACAIGLAVAGLRKVQVAAVPA